MAATRRVIDISVGEEDLAQLEAIARSRTAPASWVEGARILLAYQSDPSTYAVGEAVGVTHQTVKRCLDRAGPPRRDGGCTLCLSRGRGSARTQGRDHRHGDHFVRREARHPGDRQYRTRFAAKACSPGSTCSPARCMPGSKSAISRGSSSPSSSCSTRAYPTDTAIKLILDNHSAHISKETKAWLAARPKGRFSLVFTPKHGTWLNLVERFFSKMARSVLRHIRVASKPELKSRILAYLDEVNTEAVIHTWTYKIGQAV